MSDDPAAETPERVDDGTVLQKRVDRRGALGILLGGVAVGRAGAGRLRPAQRRDRRGARGQAPGLAGVHQEATTAS